MRIVVTRGVHIACMLFSAFGSRLSAQDTAAARVAYQQGRAALRERKNEDAVKALERAVELDPGKSAYHLWLGSAYTRLLNEVSFLRKPIIGRKIGPQFDKAVELDSSSAEAAEARVEFYIEAPGIAGGSRDKANAEVIRLKKLSPYRAAFARAKIAEKDKDWATVESEFGALMQAHPDSATPYYYFGRAASLSGLELARGESALRRFITMLTASDSLSRAVAHYRLGTIRERQRDTNGARAAYDSALAINPRYEDAIAARKKLGK